MHKDKEQYDKDKRNDKTIEEYKENINRGIEVICKNENNTDSLTIEQRETLVAMNEYSQNHMQETYEYVVRGALLYCDCGSHHRRLNLPKCHDIYIGQNPVMRRL